MDRACGDVWADMLCMSLVGDSDDVHETSGQGAFASSSTGGSMMHKEFALVSSDVSAMIRTQTAALRRVPSSARNPWADCPFSPNVTNS